TATVSTAPTIKPACTRATAAFARCGAASSRSSATCCAKRPSRISCVSRKRRCSARSTTARGSRRCCTSIRAESGVHRPEVPWSTMSRDEIQSLTNQDYKYGFVTDIEAEVVPAGLSEDIVRTISAKKGEPEWLLEWRLKAYRHWLTMQE